MSQVRSGCRLPESERIGMSRCLCLPDPAVAAVALSEWQRAGHLAAVAMLGAGRSGQDVRKVHLPARAVKESGEVGTAHVDGATGGTARQRCHPWIEPWIAARLLLPSLPALGPSPRTSRLPSLASFVCLLLVLLCVPPVWEHLQYPINSLVRCAGIGIPCGRLCAVRWTP